MAKTLMLCIGAQKAGTTWLAGNLRKHPQVTVTPLKEMHFLDRIGRPTRLFNRMTSKAPGDARWRRSMNRNIRGLLKLHTVGHRMANIRLLALSQRMSSIPAYIRLLRRLPGDVACDLTPGYAVVDRTVIRELYALAPETKIIFMMRDPIDRYWSAVRMEIIKQTGVIPPDMTLGDSMRFVTMEDERNMYIRTIENWTSVFPQSQFLPCFYEELVANPLMFLNRILEFIDVPALQSLPVPGKKHGGVQMSIPRDIERALALQFEEPTAELAAYFEHIPGINFPAEWLKHIREILRKP